MIHALLLLTGLLMAPLSTLAVTYPAPQRLCQRLIWNGTETGDNGVAQREAMSHVVNFALRGNSSQTVNNLFVKGMLERTDMVKYFNGTNTDGIDYYTEAEDLATLENDLVEYNIRFLGCLNTTVETTIVADSVGRELFLQSAVRTAWIEELTSAVLSFMAIAEPSTGVKSEAAYLTARYGPLMKGGTPNGVCTEASCVLFDDYAEIAVGYNETAPGVWINTADETAHENTVHILTGGTVAWRMPEGAYGVEQTDSEWELLDDGFDSSTDSTVFTHTFDEVGTFYYRSHTHHSMHGKIVVADRVPAPTPTPSLKTHDVSDTTWGLVLMAPLATGPVLVSIMFAVGMGTAV